MLTSSVISHRLYLLLIVFVSFLLGAATSQAQGVKGLKRDPSFMISPQDLQKQLSKQKDIVLIDVRTKEDFEKVRIPGSLNMALHTIKSRKIFKNKQLIVFNEGLNYSSLEMGCKRLVTTYGFRDVRILSGGLCLWHDLGRELEGNIFDIEKLYYVSPRDYFLDKNYDDWIVVNAATSPIPDNEDIFPSVRHLPYAGDKKSFSGKLQETLSAKKDISLPYILIFTDSGDNYQSIRQAVHPAGILNVFYLEGGYAGYKSYLNRLALQRQPERKKTKGCEVCP